MEDLENPEDAGEVMQPKFFLTSARLPPGTSDADRRKKLAEWLTENEWFAIALVNRVWAELVGEGFYPSVDDIGPDRTAIAPTALRVLAKKFQESDYDMKWLLATICKTEAYQREARPRRSPNGTPFVANVPQRLRSDPTCLMLCSQHSTSTKQKTPPQITAPGAESEGLDHETNSPTSSASTRAIPAKMSPQQFPNPWC